MGSILQDLRLALRTLLKDRGFTVVTVLTLAVAIGVNTAIFSVVDGVLLRPLPYRDADRIVTVASGRLPAPGRVGGTLRFSDRGYWHLVSNNRVFEAFGGYSSGLAQMSLTGDGQPLQAEVGRMTATAFQVLGTLPQPGRLPTVEEDVPGGPLPADDELGPSFLIRRATPGYFETMGMAVVEGRSFIPDDHNERLGSLIISKSVKDRYWPDVSALGKRIRVAGAPARSVGVVGDVHALGMDIPVEPYVYKPMLDSVGGGVGAMTMVVRSDAEPLSLVPAIRGVIEAIDPDLAISNIRSMEDVVADSMSRTSFTMSLLLLATIIALFLGSVGIYGVISYIVSQRTPEIGVRLALGADSKKVRRMILMQGMKLAGVGVVIGLLAAAAMGHLLNSLLYGVSSFDPLTFVGGSLIFLVVAALAAVIPAMRASRIPPAVALQST